MNINIETYNMDAVLLCGGEGKRLQSIVNDRPKPMVEINGRPFLDILIEYLVSFGFRRFILCTGYMGRKIKQHYQNKKTRLTFIFCEEKELLGTAGAIKNAESVIKSNPFLVMNTDSFCNVDLNKFINFHIAQKALISICLAKTQESEDYGIVELGASGQICQFNEKIKAKPGDFINTGIYLMAKDILAMIPSNKKSSLEYDLFPKITHKGFFGYKTEEKLIDIGTPQRYKKAKETLGNYYGRKTGFITS